MDAAAGAHRIPRNFCGTYSAQKAARIRLAQRSVQRPCTAVASPLAIRIRQLLCQASQLPAIQTEEWTSIGGVHDKRVQVGWQVAQAGEDERTAGRSMVAPDTEGRQGNNRDGQQGRRRAVLREPALRRCGRQEARLEWKGWR